MSDFFQNIEVDLKKATESLSDKVCRILEENILNAAYPSGTSLSEGDIAIALNVSRSPVREALLRLEAAGLVERAKKGRVVTEVKKNYIEANYAFHAALVLPCRNNALLSMYKTVLERVKWASHYSLEWPSEIEDSVNSHK